LAQSLPDYMIPAVFIPLASLPLTSNGKLDRRALPCPGNTDVVRTTRSVPPRNDVERGIAEIWCGILNLKSVGIEDNFFHLGGHSLLASQVMARLTEAFNVDLPVRLLFETPTIAGLAESVARIQREEPRRPVAIPRRLQSRRAQELLARLDELTEEEIDELLSDPDHQKITT
jgi:acyl carrier protein